MVFQSVLLLYRAKYSLSILCHLCILWAFLHLSIFALSFVTVTICRTAVVTVCTDQNGGFGRFCWLVLVVCFGLAFFFFFYYIMKEKLEIISRYLSYLSALENCCKNVLDYCNCFDNWHFKKSESPTSLWENLPALKCCSMLVVLKCYFFNSEKIFFFFFLPFFFFFSFYFPRFCSYILGCLQKLLAWGLCNVSHHALVH